MCLHQDVNNEPVNDITEPLQVLKIGDYNVTVSKASMKSDKKKSIGVPRVCC